jgi:hypothetical protein
MDRSFYSRYIIDELTGIDRQLWMLEETVHRDAVKLAECLTKKRKMLTAELNRLDSLDESADYVARFMSVMPKIVAVRPPIPERVHRPILPADEG